MTPFTVATIAREPWPVLSRFLGWHLAQGADRIILYLDDPEDPAIPRLKGEPRIDVRPCTSELWAGLGITAGARFTRRQRAVLAQAYASVAEGWMLVVDADELMWVRDITLAQALGALPNAAMSLRVKSAEQVRLADGTDAFRTPIPKKLVNEVYGEDADLLRIRNGLIYHPEGKSFHRAGQDGLNMKLHWAEGADGERTPGPVWGMEEAAHLLHFAAPDYAQWRAKVDWRAGAHGFSQPMKDRLAAIADSDSPQDGYRALYDRMHSLTDAQAEILDAHQGLIRTPPPTVSL
jgi:hypothetical protein